ncbi:hypothetical protein MVEN_00349900 [Mycena venus]|uniref:Uncharacterized protein n=1 Tax=Mycena venus TaxID=2733690 RepID=A0A8H6YTB0_9AGAR|nr:hypothetical protein MVEN_00349900 [Mycena venus]
MDHNSGPGNSGGGFDAGSGAQTAGTGFNDYGVAEVGRGGPGLGNQDNNFGTSGRTGGMDHNSGPGNIGGGFDAGSGAETAGTGYGTNRDNFGTSGGGMDHNSGPGNTGGGFDVGSGAGAGMGRTGGGNFGTSGMDHNSGPGNTGGGFDTGSGAGVGTGTGIGANTMSSSNEYGSEDRNQYGTGTSSNDYGTGATSDSNHGGKPTMKDRIKGGAEKIVGQVTKNPELVEKGQLRKEGEFSARSDDFTSY